MLSDSEEIGICGEHGQLMADAELSEKRIDCSDLDAPSATEISEFGRFDVVLSVWHDEREGGEALDDPISRPRSPEPLKQLLQHKTRAEHGFPRLQRSDQG